MDIKQLKAKTGKNIGQVYADCALQDVDGHVAKMRIWPEQWSRLKNKRTIGRPLRAVCKVNVYKGSISLMLDRVEKIGA